MRALGRFPAMPELSEHWRGTTGEEALARIFLAARKPPMTGEKVLASDISVKY